MPRFGLAQLLVVTVAGAVLAALLLRRGPEPPPLAAWGLALFALAMSLRAVHVRAERTTLWAAFSSFVLAYLGLAGVLIDQGEGFVLLAMAVAIGAALLLLVGPERSRSRRPTVS